MGHPQSLTSIICNNTTGVGLSNDTIKKKYTKAEMRDSIISQIRYNRQIFCLVEVWNCGFGQLVIVAPFGKISSRGTNPFCIHIQTLVNIDSNVKDVV